MTIPVMSSKELNDIFSNAQKETVDFQQQIQAIKKDMSKKIQIIKYENEFINKTKESPDEKVLRMKYEKRNVGKSV